MFFNWKSLPSSELCLTRCLPASQAKDGESCRASQIPNSCCDSTARKSVPLLAFRTGLRSVPQTESVRPWAFAPTVTSACHAFCFCPPLDSSLSSTSNTKLKNHLLRGAGLTCSLSCYSLSIFHVPPQSKLQTNVFNVSATCAEAGGHKRISSFQPPLQRRPVIPVRSLSSRLIPIM